MAFERITESPSKHRYLEQQSIPDLLNGINEEDRTVAASVAKVIPQLTLFIEAAADKMLAGGRLFYIGAGTSGRLGIVDASECPPTFGVPYGLVIGLIAGGEKAITRAVEHAEDDPEQGWKDLQLHHPTEKDILIGIAASGTTPYVIGALNKAREKGLLTASICCNPDSPVSQAAEHPIDVIVGPEFITGSTRMKSGTAQKLVLNMISTTLMIQLGRVEDNRMVNMQLVNDKLLDRGTRMLMEKRNIQEYDQARVLLLKHGSVKKAMEAIPNEDARP